MTNSHTGTRWGRSTRTLLTLAALPALALTSCGTDDANDSLGTTEPVGTRLQSAPSVVYVDDFGRDDRGRTYPDIGLACTAESEGGGIPDAMVVPSSHLPQDLCHDETLRQALADGLLALGYPSPRVDRYEVLDPISGEPLAGAVVVDSLEDHLVLTGPATLEHLAAYDIVVWNTRRSFPSFLELMNAEGGDNAMARYLDQGGAVWLSGTGVFESTLYDNPGVGLSPFGYEPEDFPYQYLQVRSTYDGFDCVDGCFRTSGATPRDQRENGFEGAYTSPLARALRFPELRVLREPYHTNPLRGVPNCDAMVQPLNQSLPRAVGIPDTLYYYQSNGVLELQPPRVGWMDDGATAFLYSGAAHGKLMMFGFPLFYLGDEDLVALTTAGLGWLDD